MAYKARAQQIDIPEISCQAADLSVGNRRKYLASSKCVGFYYMVSKWEAL